MLFRRGGCSPDFRGAVKNTSFAVIPNLTRGHASARAGLPAGQKRSFYVDIYPSAHRVHFGVWDSILRMWDSIFIDGQQVLTLPNLVSTLNSSSPRRDGADPSSPSSPARKTLSCATISTSNETNWTRGRGEQGTVT